MQRGRVWCKRLFHTARVAMAFALIAAAVTVTAAARTSRRVGMGVAPSSTTTTEDVRGAQETMAAGLTFAPQPGATSVAPDSPVVVRAAAGRLVSVRVSTPDGGENEGVYMSSQVWASHTPLGYGASYRVTALVSDGTTAVERTATFETLSPGDGVTVSAFPSQGLTVGVGQPVALRFSQAITDPTAARGGAPALHGEDCTRGSWRLVLVQPN